MSFRSIISRSVFVAAAALCLPAFGQSPELANSYEQAHAIEPPRLEGGQQWLPREGWIFPQLKADPRQPRLSAGYRWHDDAMESNLAMANIASQLCLWQGEGLWGFDRLQLGLQAAVWALFDMKSFDLDMINSDWYAGLPLWATKGLCKMRLRLYHISSHLGDEYILHKNVNVTMRKNPSYEVLDATLYYPVLPYLGLYATVGRLLHCDRSYPLHPLYFELGTEYYWSDWLFRSSPLKAQPYLALHARCWESHRFEPSYNAALGVSWSDKKKGAHRLNTSLEYFNGHSLEGQFGGKRTSYMYLHIAYEP